MENKINLTEEQISDREELFFTILNDFIDENYEVDQDYIMTEEDAYIVSLVLEYFEENFRYPTLQESALEEITGYDINTPLYEEMMYIMLDETVGTFVAGAAHGIKNFLAKRSMNKAVANKDKAKKNFSSHITNPGAKAKPKFKADAAQVKHDTTDYGKGILGDVKKSFNQGKIDGSKQRALKAQEAMKAAERKRKSAVGKYEHGVAKSKNLANKIDTGISNIKNRTKQAINTGAARISGILGKAVGAMSPS